MKSRQQKPKPFNPLLLRLQIAARRRQSPPRMRLWYTVMGAVFLLPALAYLGFQLERHAGANALFSSLFLSLQASSFSPLIEFFCLYLSPILVLYCAINLLRYRGSFWLSTAFIVISGAAFGVLLYLRG